MLGLFVCTAFVVAEYSYEIIQISSSPTASYPCLFVHGHRGHYSQASGLGKALKNDCAMYSVDMKEDISGLSHEVIYKQSAYIELHISALSEKYQSKVLVIGHSMGGISALLAIISAESKVSKVFTLNCPLLSSPLNSYYAFPYMYSSIHYFLKTTEIPHLSITGGTDAMVPSILTKPQEISQHIYTSQIPNVYKQFDHNTILSDSAFLNNFSGIVNGKLEQTEVEIWRSTEQIEDTDYDDIEYIGELGVGEFSIGKYGEYRIIFEKDSDVILITEEKIEKVRRRTSYLKVNPLHVSQVYIYRLQVLKDDEFFVEFHKGLTSIQYLDEEKYDFLWSEKHFQVNNIAYIRLSGNRYPVTIDIIPSALWVYAKCGSEEIIKRQAHHETLLFHEKCLDGPELWIFTSKGKVAIQIYFSDILNSFIQEFRLFIFSATVSFFFFESLRFWHCFLVVLFYFMHNLTRYYGMLFIDHVDYQNIDINALELAFILISGWCLSKIVQLLLKFIKIKSVFLSEIHRFQGLLLILVFFLPWPVFTCVIICMVCSVEISDNMRNIIFLNFLITLPQNITWWWRLQVFVHISFLNIYDFFSIFPSLLLLVTQSYTSVLPEPKLLSIYFLLFMQDLLYRGNIAISIYLLYLSISNKILPLNTIKFF